MTFLDIPRAHEPALRMAAEAIAFRDHPLLSSMIYQAKRGLIRAFRSIFVLSTQITPVNYNLLSVNVFVAITGIYQLARKYYGIGYE